ncbi:MmcQ/YjbR family DNA-binding protein [soil metagenome]
MSFLMEQAMEVCEAFPATELSYPFGEETPVFKVVGRVFAILTVEEGPGSITLKADPEDARALVSEFPEVTPGYHMNKKHWITVQVPPGRTPIEELIADSYDLVVAGLPRARRPKP